ncbi:Hypothetical protein YgzA [Bacillus subtilis subsp. subtilis str. BSP1]|nr:Hypothetical protein YgzA [Bacillus subtilis subsp. subtilis str. BSP1]
MSNSKSIRFYLTAKTTKRDGISKMRCRLFFYCSTLLKASFTVSFINTSSPLNRSKLRSPFLSLSEILFISSSTVICSSPAKNILCNSSATKLSLFTSIHSFIFNIILSLSLGRDE